MHKSRTYLAYTMLLLYSLSMVRSSYESIHLIAHLPDLFKKEFTLHSTHNHKNENHHHTFISLISDENQTDNSIISIDYSPKLQEYKKSEWPLIYCQVFLNEPINTQILLIFQEQSLSPPTQPPKEEPTSSTFA